VKHIIYKGNTLDILKKLENENVDCIITSPPYWGLRDYGEETITKISTRFRAYFGFV